MEAMKQGKGGEGRCMKPWIIQDELSIQQRFERRTQLEVLTKIQAKISASCLQRFERKVQLVFSKDSSRYFLEKIRTKSSATFQQRFERIVH